MTRTDTPRHSCADCGRALYADEGDGICVDCEMQSTEPDYGGAFDGYTVTSDADPGL